LIFESCHFEPRHFPLAVAVSGGADSMALLLLAHDFAKAQKLRLIALTVDHGIRKESASEAAQVADWCALLGISHMLLHAKEASLRRHGKQEQAREARYQLMANWCQQHGYQTLATAHHRGDQAETLFFRLGRGSTLLGLSCIARESHRNNITIIRPLLAYPKSALTSLLTSRGQPWIEDPSNLNPRYTRARLRSQLAMSHNPQDIEVRAAALADFFARMRRYVEQQVASAMEQSIVFERDNAILHLPTFTALPTETARLVLAATITRLSGKTHPPRTIQLERLASMLQSEHFSPSELAGLHFVPHSQHNIKIIGKT
jgi:tRNA(Ile)-lysidine synthase